MKKVYKKSKIKKFANGTQVVGNIDPTTLYSINRDKSVADTQFNNAQQAQLNQGNIQQGYQDKFNNSSNNFNSITTQNAANAGTTQSLANTVTSVAGSIPIVGAAVQAGTAIQQAANSAKLKQIEKKGDSEAGKGYATLANIASPSSSLLKGFEEGNITDIANGLTGGVLTPFLKGGSDAKKFEELQYQQQRQDYANQQLKDFGAVDTTMQATQLKKGNKKIYIKPENRGKFNTTKERTGKTTEELTHSSNPITRKRAIFAQNAAKWKKEAGEKSISIPIDEMVEEHKRLTNVMKSPSKRDDKKELKYQTKELKQYKRLDKKEDKSEVREIETEGREPIFSPKKKDGSRDLIYYNPNDPTHSEGGVKGLVVDKNKTYKSRSAVVIPEGSAIITAKDGMNKKALKAYKRGDKKTLEKVINSMPDDKGNKKQLGTDDLGYGFEDAYGNRYSSYAKPAYEGPLPTKPIDAPLEPVPTSQVNKTANKKTYNTSKLSSAGAGLMQAAPSIYNLGRGLFEKPQMTNRRYMNNQGLQYQDFSAPTKRAANEQFRIESNNIRNATGGSGGAYLANQSLAAANRFKNMENINTQEAAKRQDIMNANIQMGNQQRAQNLGLANQYDNLDLQNRARKNDFIASGLTGLSDLSFHRQRDKNMANADQMRLNTLESSQYRFDPVTGKYIFKSALGAKNLKYKKNKK